MLTNTELSFGATMGFFVEFIPAFLLIRRIILRSKFVVYLSWGVFS